MFCLVARAARDSVCKNGPGPENPAHWGAAGSRVSRYVTHTHCSYEKLLWQVYLSVTSTKYAARHCKIISHSRISLQSEVLPKYMYFMICSQLLCGYVWRWSKRLWGMYRHFESNSYWFKQTFIDCSRVVPYISYFPHPGSEEGSWRHLSVRAWGLGSLSLHLQDSQHLLCPQPH